MFQKKKPFEKAASTGEGTAAHEPVKSTTPRGFVDSKRYTVPLTLLHTLQEQLAGMASSLEGSAKEVAGIEEDRRQEGATHAFDLKLKRDAQLTAYAQQDAEREASFADRDMTLTSAETDFCSLLGIEITPGNHLTNGKAIKTAFDECLKAQFLAGQEDGLSRAQASAAVQKQIADAIAVTDKKLLEQENKQLKDAVNELKAANAKLLDAQTTTNATVAEVAKTGLNAAAGVVSKANDALGTAAGAYPGGSRTGR